MKVCGEGHATGDCCLILESKGLPSCRERQGEIAKSFEWQPKEGTSGSNREPLQVK